MILAATGCYGKATHAKRKISIGRYVPSPLGKSLLIRDNSKVWYVSYESEPEPVT